MDQLADAEKAESRSGPTPLTDLWLVAYGYQAETLGCAMLESGKASMSGPIVFVRH